MKVCFDFDDVNRMTTVTGTPGLYDASGLYSPQCFVMPRARHPDRMYAAAALLFNAELSGSLELVGDYSCSRHVALEIERFFGDIDMVVVDQEFTPRPRTIGDYITAIDFPFCASAKPVRVDTSIGEFLVRYMPDSIGAVFSDHEIVLGTNISASSAEPDEVIDDVLRLLGFAVLMAEDFRSAGFRLPPCWDSQAAEQRLQAAASLLLSVSLSLTWDN